MLKKEEIEKKKRMWMENQTKEGRSEMNEERKGYGKCRNERESKKENKRK